jgi:hypothetical protein
VVACLDDSPLKCLDKSWIREAVGHLCSVPWFFVVEPMAGTALTSCVLLTVPVLTHIHLSAICVMSYTRMSKQLSGCGFGIRHEAPTLISHFS